MSTSPRSFLEEEQEAIHDLVEESKDLKSSQTQNIAIDATVHTTDEHPFKWLNGWLLVFPMICRYTTKNGQMVPRNDIFYKIAVSIVALFCLWWWIHWITMRKFIADGFTLTTIVWSLAVALMNMSRLLTLYYFWNHDELFGIDKASNDAKEIELDVVKQSTYLVGSEFRQTQYRELTTQFSRRMRIILYLVLTLMIVIVAIKLALTFTDKEFVFDFEAAVHIIASTLLSKYIYNVPFFLVQFMLSIQYYRGCMFVMSLNERLEKSVNYNVNWKELTKEYIRFRVQFKESTKLLEYIIKCRIAALIAFIWIDISEIIESETRIDALDSALWITVSLMPFIELVFAGNSTTVNFHAFRDKLYEVGQCDAAEISTEYLYFLDYLNRYPFLIQIFAKEISFKNALKVTAAFAVAKTVTYLFKAHAI